MRNILSKYFSQFSALFQSKVIKSLGWILGGNLFSNAISFLGTMIVLRHLSTDGIALLYPLLGIFHIANQFGDFGITTGFIKAGSQCYNKQKKDFPKILQAALELKLLSATLTLIVGLIIARYVSELTFKSADYTGYVRVIFLGSFFSIMGGYTNSLLQIQEKFKTLSAVKSVPPILKFIVIVIALYLFSFSFEQVYFAYLLIPIGTFILGMFFIPLSLFNLKLKTISEKKNILRTSKWVYISSLATVGYGQVDILMVRSMLSKTELAHLVGGQKLSALIPILTVTLITVLLPKISAKTSKKELNYFFRKTLLFIPAVIIIFFVGIFSADYVIPFVLGDKYLLSISIFKYYLIGFSLSLYITPTSLILYSLNKEHLFIVMNIF